MSKDTTSEGITFNDIFMFMIAVPSRIPPSKTYSLTGLASARCMTRSDTPATLSHDLRTTCPRLGASSNEEWVDHPQR